MDVYSSYSNINNFDRSGIPISSVFKRYALIYDRVIFNRMGCPIGALDMFPDLPTFVAGLVGDQDDLKERLKLGRNSKFCKMLVDMWEMVESPEVIDTQAREYVSEFDQRKISDFAWGRNLIDAEMGIDNHHKEYKAVATVANDIISDLGFNFLLKHRFDDFGINFAPVISDVYKSSCDNANVNTLFSTNLVIPNFDQLSWEQILELREDKYLKAFRQKVHSYKAQQGALDTLLSEELMKNLWDIAEQAKPDVGKAIFETVTSNLPSPTIVNPFGLYYGVRDIVKNSFKMNENSWIYFVQQFHSQAKECRRKDDI